MSHLNVLQIDCQSFINNSAAIGSSVERLTRFFDGFMPRISSAFEIVKSFSSKPKYEGLQKEQMELLSKLERHSYHEVRLIKAFVPENFTGTFLPYAKELEKSIDHALSFNQEMLDPYVFFLAGIASEKFARLSSVDHVQNNKKYEQKRVEIEKELVSFFKSSKYETTSTVSEVCERNADWKEILEVMQQISLKMHKLNLSALQTKTAQAEDYLEAIYLLVRNNQMQNATTEVLNHLVDGAYQIACELEFISVTYYRSLTITQAVKDTIESIKKAIP